MFSGTSSLLVVCHPALSSSKIGMRPLGDVARDFVEVKLHGLMCPSGNILNCRNHL